MAVRGKRVSAGREASRRLASALFSAWRNDSSGDAFRAVSEEFFSDPRPEAALRDVAERSGSSYRALSGRLSELACAAHSSSGVCAEIMGVPVRGAESAVDELLSDDASFSAFVSAFRRSGMISPEESVVVFPCSFSIEALASVAPGRLRDVASAVLACAENVSSQPSGAGGETVWDSLGRALSGAGASWPGRPVATSCSARLIPFARIRSSSCERAEFSGMDSAALAERWDSVAASVGSSVIFGTPAGLVASVREAALLETEAGIREAAGAGVSFPLGVVRVRRRRGVASLVLPSSAGGGSVALPRVLGLLGRKELSAMLGGLVESVAAGSDRRGDR